MWLSTAGAQIVSLADYLPPDAVGHGFGAVSVFRGRLHARTPAKISELLMTSIAVSAINKIDPEDVCILYLQGAPEPGRVSKWLL